MPQTGVSGARNNERNRVERVCAPDGANTKARAGDTSGAVTRIEQRFGIGYWTLSICGRAMQRRVTLHFARLRAVYIAMCERQIGKLQHEIQFAKACGDDDLDDLEAEALALAQKIAARKARAMK